MVLGFKKQFKPKILSGEKIHTIREDSHNRWKPGNSIQFATGVRTKNYNKFKDGVCEGTQVIEIKYSKDSKVPEIWIDGVRQSCMDDHWLIAKNDGFDTLEDFYKWFNKDFTGKLIHWTQMSY